MMKDEVKAAIDLSSWHSAYSRMLQRGDQSLLHAYFRCLEGNSGKFSRFCCKAKEFKNNQNGHLDESQQWDFKSHFKEIEQNFQPCNDLVNQSTLQQYIDRSFNFHNSPKQTDSASPYLKLRQKNSSMLSSPKKQSGRYSSLYNRKELYDEIKQMKYGELFNGTNPLPQIEQKFNIHEMPDKAEVIDDILGFLDQDVVILNRGKSPSKMESVMSQRKRNVMSRTTQNSPRAVGTTNNAVAFSKFGKTKDLVSPLAESVISPRVMKRLDVSESLRNKKIKTRTLMPLLR